MKSTRTQAAPLLLPMPRHQSLPERVAQILKRYILADPLAPGDRLPTERRLADALNVSRTVVREALSQLMGEGIVVRQSPRAIVVADFDRGRLAADLALLDTEASEMRHLIELRVIIEVGAIEAIVERATVAQLREIERWVVEGERRLAAEEPIVFADVRFHAALLHTLGNDAIDSLLPLIEEHLRQNFLADAHQLSGTGTPDDHRVVAQHRQIFEAVKRRDAETARLVMLAHLNAYLRRPKETEETVESQPTAHLRPTPVDQPSPSGRHRRSESR